MTKSLLPAIPKKNITYVSLTLVCLILESFMITIIAENYQRGHAEVIRTGNGGVKEQHGTNKPLSQPLLHTKQIHTIFLRNVGS